VKYALHPAAEQDLADAVDFYAERAGRQVAQRFLDEFERVAELLAANTGLGAAASKGRRTFTLRTFPYSVVYRPVGGGIRIVVVRHQHRRPGYGAARR
jgi:plasmid stabilization system protein ParE